MLADVLDTLDRTPSAKERAILDVALRLFSQHGYRHTSMEDIAFHAGVAKGTIYLYVANKESLFRDLCGYVVDHVMAQVYDVILLDAPYAHRITAVLRTKFGFLYRIVASAPHGRELVESRDSLASDIFKRFDQRFEKAVASLVERGIACGQLQSTSQRLNPRSIAQVLIAAMRGVSSVARDAGDFDRRTESAIALLLEGLRRS
ncbi:MAG: TetR/AcrR family transcriptional regulator [Vulcanimicrobiaceae bacterium]